MAILPVTSRRRTLRGLPRKRNPVELLFMLAFDHPPSWPGLSRPSTSLPY
jgi:hypothetical protein